MKRSAASGIVFGIFIIAFGLLALSKGLFGFTFGVSFAGFWALVIVAVSIVSIIHRGFKFWNLVFLITGGWIFVDSLGFLGRHTFAIVVALLLVAFGVWIIINATSHQQFSGDCCNGGPTKVNVDSNDYVKYDCSFCEIKVSNTSKCFKGGKVSVAFGHMYLDLSQIEIQGEAMIDVSSVFGSLEIKLPRNMPYSTDFAAGVGSFINNVPTFQPVAGAPFLEIKGSAVFGACKLI